MNTFAKFASAAAVAGIMAVSMATPSQAWSGHHHGDRGAAAAIGFGAGALVGAAAANAAYGPDYGYDDSYAYAPGPAYGDDYAYAPAPRYHGWNSGSVNERLCTTSPGTVNYVPCANTGD